MTFQQHCTYSKFYLFLILLIVNSVDKAASSTWESFLIAHSIDPNEAQNSNYGMWNGAQWRQWLADREPLHPALPKLTQKRINSVVVGSPADILDAFIDQSNQLNDQFVWSSRRFRMYVFLASGGGFQRVLDCLELYFAVPPHCNTRDLFEYYDPLGRFFFLNSFVHSIMYPYSALRFKIPRKLAMALTTVQILQMLIALYINGYLLHKMGQGLPCYRHRDVTFAVGFAAASFAILNFFVKTYLAPREKAKTQ